MAHDQRILRNIAGLAGLAAAAGLLGPACGPGTSLDAQTPAGSSTTGLTTGDTALVDTSDSHRPDPADTSSGPDLPGPDLPDPDPPGSCPADCELVLSEVWRWDEDPASVDPPPAERRITELVRTLNDAIVIAEVRDGLPWLTRVSKSGTLLWSRSLQSEFGCLSCEITGMVATEDGKLLVAAGGEFGPSFPVVLIGKLELSRGNFEWSNWDFLSQFTVHSPRTGSLFVFDEVYSGVLVIESNYYGDPYTTEALELFLFETAFFSDRFFIDSQPYSEQPWRPLGRRTADGAIAVALTDTAGSQADGYLVWLDPIEKQPIEVELLPSPADDLVLGASYDALTVGHDAASTRQLSVYVSRAPSSLPLDWVHTQTVPTTSASAPALAVDGTGRPIVATRITGPDPEDAALSLSRLALDGIPEWTTTLPLATDASARPVRLVVDSLDAIELVTLVDGRLHVEKRQQDCQCG